MEDEFEGTRQSRNPKYLIGGIDNGNVFVIVGGNDATDIGQNLQMANKAFGGYIPKLNRADIYVKLENGVVAPRTGFDITIPDESS